MQILITGGTGLIGNHLVPRLLELGHDVTVVTRNPDKARTLFDPKVTFWKGLNDHQNLDGFDAVINLAGEPIADKRWTESQKQRLCQSRWQITERLVEMFKASQTPPSVFISGSATGYYGDLGEVVVNEDEPPHNEFTHKLCARWEQNRCGAPKQADTCLPAAYRRSVSAQRRDSGKTAADIPFRSGWANGRWAAISGVDSYRRYGKRHFVAVG